jgi:hypothetical protein
MGTILRLGSYRVMIYTDDHRPAHIHARGPDGEIVFWLNCPKGPIELRSADRKVSEEDIRKLAKFVKANIGVLCAEWRRTHVNY